MISIDSISEVQKRIEAAAIKANRSPSEIALMAVSKTQSREAVLAAVGEGLLLFGENRVQEALAKFENRPSNLQLHLIGPLQSNKVNKAVGFFSVIQSVDSILLAKKIDSRASSLGIVQRIFLQQNCSGEESKSGFASSTDLFNAVDQIREFSNICIEGLMTIGPADGEATKTQKAFSLLRENFLKLKNEHGLTTLKELSMGMSGDLELAIKEGSTLVRVGTALFGKRDYGVASGL